MPESSLERFLIDNNLGIEEVYSNCGFVYFDIDQSSGQSSGRVYWNLEKDQNKNEVIRLALQDGVCDQKMMSIIREAIRRYIIRDV